MNKILKEALELAREVVYTYRTKILPLEVKKLLHKLNKTTNEDATSNKP